MTIRFIKAPTTGTTAFFSDQSKDTSAFPTTERQDDFAAYCLDAPDYIPTGQTIHACNHRGITYGQANFVHR